jgi:cytidine deaminase
MRNETKVIQYTVYDSRNELSVELNELLDNALIAMKNAHAPYSKFKVGAAVRLEEGTIVKGSNQENIAYPSGLCAERVALFAAGSNFPNQTVTHLAIVAEGELLPASAVLSPCGACRQVMAETYHRQGQRFEILLLNPDGSLYVFSGVDALLPFIFGS